MAALPADYSGWLRGFGVQCFDCHPNATGRIARGLGPLIRQWLRRGTPLRTSDTLWGVDRLFRMDAEEIRTVISGLPRGLHEFVFHPRGTAHDADLAALLQLRA